MMVMVMMMVMMMVMVMVIVIAMVMVIVFPRHRCALRKSVLVVGELSNVTVHGSRSRRMKRAASASHAVHHNLWLLLQAAVAG